MFFHKKFSPDAISLIEVILFLFINPPTGKIRDVMDGLFDSFFGFKNSLYCIFCDRNTWQTYFWSKVRRILSSVTLFGFMMILETSISFLHWIAFSLRLCLVANWISRNLECGLFFKIWFSQKTSFVLKLSSPHSSANQLESVGQRLAFSLAFRVCIRPLGAYLVWTAEYDFYSKTQVVTSAWTLDCWITFITLLRISNKKLSQDLELLLRGIFLLLTWILRTVE